MPFYGAELLAPTSNLQSGVPSLVGCPVCLFSILVVSLRIWRLSLHPLPEDTPCRANKSCIEKACGWFAFLCVLYARKRSIRHVVSSGRSDRREFDSKNFTRNFSSNWVSVVIFPVEIRLQFEIMVFCCGVLCLLVYQHRARLHYLNGWEVG